MQWPQADVFLASIDTPKGYTFRQAREDDVEVIAASLRAWYPDIVGGDESCHLEPQFLRNETFLEDGDPNQHIWPLVGHHHETGELTAMMTLERYPRSHNLTVRMGAVSPEHRGPLGLMGPLVLTALGRVMEASMVYYWATLKTKAQQVIAKRYGYRLVGIMPAHDIDMVRPEHPKLVFEALYAKILAPRGDLEIPSPEVLTRETRRLWQLLFDALGEEGSY